MTKPKAQTIGPSGPGAIVWSDGDLVPSMPDLADSLHDTGVDVAAFTEWLREPLARYRVHQRARAQMAQCAAVIQWLQAAADDLPAALADGRLRRLPAWFAEPAVWHAANKMGQEWHALLRSDDRPAIAQCLTLAIGSLRRQRVRRGRSSERERDSLLLLVVERLKAGGLASGEARHRADAVLVACSVPSPEESIARAARRGRGAISV